MAGLLIMLNVYFSSYFQISIFRWIKVIEVYLLFIFIKENKQLKLVNDLIYPLVLSAIIFSLLGIVQFYYQHTLGGIFRFLGERSFTSETTGIAKVSLFGRETLRAYSTFSHPNSMAGYLAAVLLFVRATLKQNKNDERLLMVFYITLFVGLVLTFSKGVLMALLIIVAMMVLTRYKETVFRLVTRYFVLLVLLTTFLILLIPVQISETSVMQRLFLNRAALEVLMTNPLTGVGLGAFIINLPGLSNMLNIRWILQPVHNIYLLILAETGLIGLILFTAGATTVFNKANKSIIFVLMFILITGLLDHYWLTLQQNLMFIGIILAVSERPFEQNIVVFKDNG
jgi:O-antigen ligase